MAEENKRDLYGQLFKEFRLANSTLSHNQCDIRVSVIWKAVKSQNEKIREEINRWKLINQERKSKLDKFWTSFTSSSSNQKDKLCTNTDPLNAQKIKEEIHLSTVNKEQSIADYAQKIMAMENKRDLYGQLFKEFRLANYTLSHNQCDIKVSIIWKTIKTRDEKIKEEINRWKLINQEQKSKLDKFWTSLTKKCTSSNSDQKDKLCTNTDTQIALKPKEEIHQSMVNKEQPIVDCVQKIGSTPIIALESDIISLESKKWQSIATDEELERLSKYRKDLYNNEKLPKIEIDSQVRSQKKRKNDEMIIGQIKATYPETAAALCKRPNVGTQPELLKATTDIGMCGSVADE